VPWIKSNCRSRKSHFLFKLLTECVNASLKICNHGPSPFHRAVDLPLRSGALHSLTVKSTPGQHLPWPSALWVEQNEPSGQWTSSQFLWLSGQVTFPPEDLEPTVFTCIQSALLRYLASILLEILSQVDSRGVKAPGRLQDEAPLWSLWGLVKMSPSLN